MRSHTPRVSRTLPVILALLAVLRGSGPAAASVPGAGHLAGAPLRVAAHAVVSVTELARQGRLAAARVAAIPVRALVPADGDDDAEEPGAAARGPAISMATPAPFVPLVASPGLSLGFAGLDDIPMVDSSYVVIPADLSGAVGLDKILQACNNNYRILNKADGSIVKTVGTATFWSGTGATLNTLTDPRTLYDPYNNRWIVVMISDYGTANSSIEIGLSQTADPSGYWNLYRVGIAGAGTSADFPCVGFNKNWIGIAVNMLDNSTGAFTGGTVAVIDYAQLRAGVFSGAAFSGASACSAPCVTYSTTENALYIAAHLSSGGATYRLDSITGTGAAPVYNVGGALTRPGGAWVQPSGNLLPQSGPASGASACGATPCKLETQDAQIRSAPVYRNGFLYYAQTVGLPSTGLTHTGIQWTKLSTPSGAVVDGGRLEDPTANSTNGGKWYAYGHIAVNAAGDFLVGFTQFGSAQHPSAGYAMHLAAAAAGTIRDAVIAHAGEDYYHKTFTTATGRNRWGDYSTAQVDPLDDQALWAVAEYGKARPGTDDGNTSTNSSRWASWWVAVAGSGPLATLDPGPSLPEGAAGTTPFTFTVRLSKPSILPVTVSVQTVDGTAVAASGDYQALVTQVVLPAGVTTAPVTVNVTGDTTPEANETFTLQITGVTNGGIGATGTATGTIVNDDVDAPPVAHVTSPNGGENLTVGALTTLQWTATDDHAVASVSLLVSRDGGGSWLPIATDIPNSGSYAWTVAGPGTNTGATPVDDAFFKVVAKDNANQTGEDSSDQPFSIFDPGAAAVGGDTPTAFALGAAWPNPTSGPLHAQFAVPRTVPVRLSLLDLQGREVAVLAQGVHAPGRYDAAWNGRASGGPVAAGMYFLRLRTPGRDLVRRLVVAH